MLRWSINLFKVFGIQLEVHASFVLLLAYAAWEGWRSGRALGLVWSILLTILFFVCVILHELGHSLTARRFGVRVPRILLLPIGGMAQLDRIPRKPSQELLITVAGPAVNYALVALLLPFIWKGFSPEYEFPLYSFKGLLFEICRANITMGLFNLIPVFPMDGGRILRALLAIKTSYLQATYRAVVVGRVLSLLIVLIVILCPAQVIEPASKMMLCSLFFFIFWAGDMEYRYILRQENESRYLAELVHQAKAPLYSNSSEPPPPPLLV